MAKDYPEVNDCSDSYEYTDLECDSCLDPGCADYKGDGVQFSGLLAGEQIGNDNDAECVDKLDPLIMGAIYNAKVKGHGEVAIQLKPGLYHQSEIQSVIDQTLDSISIPKNTILRIFNSLPGSEIIFEARGAMVIQNGMHHPINDPLAQYKIPDCMAEKLSCGVQHAKPDPNAPSIDENMHLWFGDCSPRRWFEIECVCNLCGPASDYSSEYGSYKCPELGSNTSQTSDDVCENAASLDHCQFRDMGWKDDGDDFTQGPNYTGSTIAAGTVIKHKDAKSPGDGEHYWICHEEISAGHNASMAIPSSEGDCKWSKLTYQAKLRISDLDAGLQGTLLGEVNPNSKDKVLFKSDSLIGCCSTGSAAGDDCSPAQCQQWDANSSIKETLVVGHGIYDQFDTDHVYEVMVEGIPEEAAGCSDDGSCRPEHLLDWEIGGVKVLKQHLKSEGAGCEDDLSFCTDDDHDNDIDYDCPCCSVELAPPDGKDNCGRCIPCFNDNDANDNDLDLCSSGSQVFLKTDCTDKHCEAGELQVIFNICVIKVAKCNEKPPTGIPTFDPENYVPTMGDVAFHDTVMIDGKATKTVTQSAFFNPELLGSTTSISTINFQGECWKVQSSTVDVAVNLTKGLKEHNPGMTVGDLSDASGGDDKYDRVDVNVNFDHSVIVKYHDGEVVEGPNHNITFNNAQVKFCPCEDAATEGNDNDCDCHKGSQGIRWKKEIPGKRDEVDDVPVPGGELNPAVNGGPCPGGGNKNMANCPEWDEEAAYDEGDAVKYENPDTPAVGAQAYQAEHDIQAGVGALANNPPPQGGWLAIEGCCPENADPDFYEAGCGACCFSLRPEGERGNPVPQDLIEDDWTADTVCWHGGFSTANMDEELYSIVQAGAPAAVNGDTLIAGKQTAIINAYNPKDINVDLNAAPGAEQLKEGAYKEQFNGVAVYNAAWGNNVVFLEHGFGVSDLVCRNTALALARAQILMPTFDRKGEVNGGDHAKRGDNYDYKGKSRCSYEGCGEEEDQAQTVVAIPPIPTWEANPGMAITKVSEPAGGMAIMMDNVGATACRWSKFDERNYCCGDDDFECPVEFPNEKDKNPSTSTATNQGAGECKGDFTEVPWSLNFYNAAEGDKKAIVPIENYMNFNHPVELILDGSNDYNLRIYLDANIDVDASSIDDDTFEDEDEYSIYDKDNLVTFDGEPINIADAEWGFNYKQGDDAGATLGSYAHTSMGMTKLFPIPSYDAGIIQPGDDNDSVAGEGEAADEDKKNLKGDPQNGKKGWYGKFTGKANVGDFAVTGATEDAAPFGYNGADWIGGFEDRNGLQWNQFDNRPTFPNANDNGFKLSSEDTAESQYFSAIANRGDTSYSLAGDETGHKYYQEGTDYSNSYDIHQIAEAEFVYNKAPVIYYKTKVTGFINGTSCSAFATYIQKCCDQPLVRLKSKTAHPDPKRAPALDATDEEGEKDCGGGVEQAFGPCERVGDPWDFDSDQPYLEGEWFAYVVDPDEDYADDKAVEPYAGIGNFKVGDWVFYPGGKRQLSAGFDQSSGGGPHIAQVTDILHFFPVGEHFPHYFLSDQITGQIGDYPCKRVVDPETGLCTDEGEEVLGSNYMWHQHMDVGRTLKNPWQSVPNQPVDKASSAWRQTYTPPDCSGDDKDTRRHSGVAHIILCKVLDKEDTAWTSKPEPIDTLAHHEYLVNLSRFAIAPKYTDLFKDGHAVSFTGEVTVPDAKTTGSIRYNDYLKNQARYQGCMIELMPGSSDNPKPWDDGSGSKYSYYPLPKDRDDRVGSNVIYPFNTDKAVLPIPITREQISVNADTVLDDTVDIIVSNTTHKHYIRCQTETQHHYERGYKVVFDAQMEGGVFEVQQIPSPKVKEYKHRFTVLPVSRDCVAAGGVDLTASIFIPPCPNCCEDEGSQNASNDAECEKIDGCTSLLRDPECELDSCSQNQMSFDVGDLEFKKPNVVGLALETRIAERVGKGLKTEFSINTIEVDKDGICLDAPAYIANFADKDYLKNYGANACNNDEYYPTAMSANTVNFYHQLSYVEFKHSKNMFDLEVEGLVAETCSELDE